MSDKVVHNAPVNDAVAREPKAMDAKGAIGKQFTG